MVLIVVLAFGLQMFFAHPEPASIFKGLFTPQFKGVDSVMLAAGILGATVMPHAIYLHSALTQKRVIGITESERKKIFQYEFFDVLIAMIIAGAVNASMLIVAASLFFDSGQLVEDLDVAFTQFGEIIGPFAAILFGVALLASGLASSSVGTKTGDIIMQGYIKRRIPLYLRRAITMLPPLAIIASGVNPTAALVLSQVILSFGIPFALVPLIIFTSNQKIMGNLVNHWLTKVFAWSVASIIILLNLFLSFQMLQVLF